jgi:hypothetical protein
MKYIKGLSLLTFLSILIASCAKGPGEGGRASITGKIFATNYNNSYLPVDSGYIGGYNVYIKYGDQPGIADNTDTDPNGVFRFNYLREGKYSIIVYSKKLANNVLDSAIITNVEITSRKQDLVPPVIKVNTFKN